MRVEPDPSALGSGLLDGMRAFRGEPVRYQLELEGSAIALNELLGERLSIEFDGRIVCCHCGRVTRKSYADGHCYQCFKTLASCDLCVVAPDRCHYAAGTCREPAWGEAFCMQPHVVYLANSAGLKVGITKPEHLPGRWLDQGASEALPIIATKTRHQAGCVEAALAQFVADRTDWRRLVREDAPPLDLLHCAADLYRQAATVLEGLAQQFPGQLERLDAGVERFVYPVLRYAAPPRALRLVEAGVVGGELLGIKGQYLLFDSGVFNVRRHRAYHLAVRLTPGETPRSDQLELFE